MRKNRYTYVNFFIYFIISTLLALLWVRPLGEFSNTEKFMENLHINNRQVEEKQIQNNIPSQTSIILEDVPFTAQAPTWNWEDIIYQEWCEEASMLMSIFWSRDEDITMETAHAEILNIYNFEKTIYGDFLDISIYDTARVLNEYFSFTQYKVIENITKDDIIESIKRWNIVIIPAFWRDLNNIHYTPPGPIPHMLVIIWYDPEKKEFITNDPWTINGKQYPYNEDVLYNAIWVYPSNKGGVSPPNLTEKRKKAGIEIQKEKS